MTRREEFRCPFCDGGKPLKGFNDLSSLIPELASEWDDKKNISTPEEFTIGSSKKVHWTCKLGHNYEMPIKMRTLKNRNCPVCANKKLLKGFNDLFIRSPISEQFWNFNLNELDPETVIFNTNKILIHWICPDCEYSWTQTPYKMKHKTIHNFCPKCSINSKWESIFEKFLSQNYSGIIEIRKRPLKYKNTRFEIDFILPELKLGFEIQDFSTHSKKSNKEELPEFFKSVESLYKKGPKYHELKRALAKEQLDIELIDIWEDEIDSGEYKNIILNLLQK